MMWNSFYVNIYLCVDTQAPMLTSSPAAHNFLLRFSNLPSASSLKPSMYSSSAPSHSDNLNNVIIPPPLHPKFRQLVQEPHLVMKPREEETIQQSMQSLSLTVDAKMCQEQIQPNDLADLAC